MNKFKTRLRLEEYKPNEWVMLEALVYTTSRKHHHTIAVPRGFITDLASIPAIFRSFYNRNGKSRKAAVIHDYLYCSQLYSRSESDDIFLEAMEACDVGRATRWSMWVAVRAGGWVYWNRRQSDPLGADDFVPDDFFA